MRAVCARFGSNMSDTLGLLVEAVNFAAIKHKDQRRKDAAKTPYINHPIGVAHVLWKEGGVSDLVVLQVSAEIIYKPWASPVMWFTTSSFKPQTTISHKWWA